MSFDEPGEERYRPDDGCPLFSQALEDHLVAVSRGEAPNRGRFCGNCYTPISPSTSECPHCGESTKTGRRPVNAVPDEIMETLRAQRKTESRWVTYMAYLGLLIAIVGGLLFVLAVPFLKGSLIWATVVYGLILLVGGRSLAGILGGYYGDRIGFERARANTRAAWERIVAERSTAKA
ncbi:MAG: hypothetical protein H6675_03605 [Dehalococcoidia bacterium]|nr:hypothetical protein [Dehalococcoidia bacterium]